jgi:hypothetical protein
MLHFFLSTLLLLHEHCSKPGSRKTEHQMQCTGNAVQGGPPMAAAAVFWLGSRVEQQCVTHGSNMRYM